MNLTKLFNINYFIQNMKKSKNILLLCLILMPILSAILLMMIGSGTKMITVVSSEISIVNNIGMYIIPIAISMCLFGYVFKRNSVDFINSMPLSRKTIFVTNTLGGIIIIAVIQLLALALTWFTSLFSSVIIFNGLLIDVFFMMLISYIFVFTASNLAMTISGNYLTQMAVTLLILFLIPFSLDAFNRFNDTKQIKLEDSSYSFVAEKESSYTYTRPYELVSNIIKNSEYREFDFKGMRKMVILSGVYIIIGMFLFERRKMENTEESFANVYIHLFVKILTLVPFIVLVTIIDAEMPFFIFEIALISAYYFIYDILTKRKVKFILSVGSLAVSLIILLTIFNIIKDQQNSYKYNLKLDNIKEISIKSTSNSIIYSNREIFISDKDLIKYIYDNIEGNVTSRYLNYSSSLYIMRDNKNYNSTVYCTLKMNNGDKIRIALSCNKEMRDNIKSKLMESDKMKSELKEICTLPENAIYFCNDNLIDEDTVNIIKKELNSFNSNVGELLNNHDVSNYRYDFKIYVYENHNVIEINIPIDLTENTFKAITKFLNSNSYQLIKKGQGVKMGYNIQSKLSEYLNIDEKEENIYNSALGRYCAEEMNNFIEENHNEACNMNEKYYIISCHMLLDNRSNHILFFTNKVDEINKIISNAVEEHKDELYKYYNNTKGYYEDVEYDDKEYIEDDEVVEYVN